MTIGENIKNARKKQGMTQKELGDRLNVTAATISAFENDKSNIKHSTLEKFAEALNTTVYELRGEEHNKIISSDNIYNAIINNPNEIISALDSSLKGQFDIEVALILRQPQKFN